MNDAVSPRRSGLVNALAILGAFLIVAALVLAMRRYAQPVGLDANRGAERAKALQELRGAEAIALNNPAWIDKGKGVVRLRIQDAMEMVDRQWSQNPAAFRSNLLARVEKATAVPPKQPEAPSAFE